MAGVKQSNLIWHTADSRSCSDHNEGTNTSLLIGAQCSFILRKLQVLDCHISSQKLRDNLKSTGVNASGNSFHVSLLCILSEEVWKLNFRQCGQMDQMEKHSQEETRACRKSEGRR